MDHPSSEEEIIKVHENAMKQSTNSYTFNGGRKVDFSRRAVFSKVTVYSRAYRGYNFFALLLKTI
jgi:hypothetical protein